MSKFILAFQNNLNNDTGNSNPGNNQDDNNEQNIPEGAIQVTGFTGDYEKYNGIYLQKENPGYNIEPDYGYPYLYEHEEGICELVWSFTAFYWYFMTNTDHRELAGTEGTVGVKPKHPSNYSYYVSFGINSNNPTVK